MVFKNPFLSVAGQRERIRNVRDVLKQSLNPFSREKVQVTRFGKRTRKVLGFVANNPFTSAFLVTPVGRAGRTAFAGISKAIVKKAGVKGVGAGLVGAGALATSKRVRSAVTSFGIPTPEKLLRGGAELGRVVDEPQRAGELLRRPKDTVKDLGLLAGLGALGIGAGVVAKSKLSKIKPFSQNNSPLPPVLTSSGGAGSPLIKPPQAEAKKSPTKRKRRKRKPVKITQSVKVKVVNVNRNINKLNAFMR